MEVKKRSGALAPKPDKRGTIVLPNTTWTPADPEKSIVSSLVSRRERTANRVLSARHAESVALSSLQFFNVDPERLA